jgi:hypothetical protein
VLALKAPVEFFERIDRWCEEQQQARGMTVRPSRPAAIRYIVTTSCSSRKSCANAEENARRRRSKNVNHQMDAHRDFGEGENNQWGGIRAAPLLYFITM